MASMKIKSKSEALEDSKQKGIDIVCEDDDIILWSGPHCGNIKHQGPLHGKKIAILVASEFSDFQVYYLSSYIGEYGGAVEFVMIDWVKYKDVRPNVSNKGVRGMWDISVDPMLVLMGSDKASRYKALKNANPNDYDAMIIVGGHSADVMVTEKEVIDFIQTASANGAVLGCIGEGSMPLISAGIVHGKKCAGNRVVDYMLKKIADFQPAPVVTDGKLVTARDTVNTPAFLNELCKVFDPNFQDVWKGSLSGKKVMFLIGEDYEDIELIVPVMEFFHRGASVIIGMFEPQFKSRSPAHLNNSNIAVGNFGTTVPFQEIPESYYTIKKLDKINMDELDIVVITGAFNPWNIVATGTTEWLKEAYAAGKKISAICHGPIPVAAADLVKGKKVTGWLASKDAVEIMGASEFNPKEWSAVIDGQIITGRLPPDVPEFVDAISVSLLD